jgi:hypothetical protein
VRDTSGENSGISDKRLLAVEAEFARVLTNVDRRENTLSPVVRSAWDSGDLNILTKTSPVSARGAHISVIGHITRDELRRNLNSTETANGFANRFLWIAVRRSKRLPFGGNLPSEQLKPLADKVKKAVKFARKHETEIEFSPDARKIWRAIYGPLSDDREGLVGAIVSRAEAQVLRLACVYAALDCSPKIELAHLDAALALWDYCERSAVLIFGDSLGDPMADSILGALRQKQKDGLTRTEISAMLGRNVDSGWIQAALDTLSRKGLATFTKKGSGGRPGERWKARNQRPLFS